MAILLLVFVFLVILLPVLYWLALPKPYPGIPYNHESAKRLSGDRPALLAHYKATKEVASFSVGQCKKLESPIIQLFLKPLMKPFIIIDDHRESEDILLRRFKEFDRAPSTINYFRPLIPHATIAMQSTPKMRSQRQLWLDTMTPSFLRNVVAPNLHKASVNLVELWRLKASLVDRHPFEAQHDIHVAAFDGIWLALMGTELGTTRVETEALKTAAANGLSNAEDKDALASLPDPTRTVLYDAMFYLYGTIDALMSSPNPKIHHWFIRRGSQYRASRAIVNREISKLMKQAKANFDRLCEAGVDGQVQPTCCMDLVIRRELTRAKKAGIEVPRTETKEIADELLMLFVAGHDTTATTIGWMVKLLANYPQKQTLLREAIRAVFPNNSPSDPPDALEILTANIPYLDGYIEESNRFSNTIPLLARVATTDTKVLGYKIPKGATIMCNPQFMGEVHHVPEHLRSPSSQEAGVKHGTSFKTDDIEAFQPERWLTTDPEGGQVYDAYSMPRLAFSAGPRGCFGKRLALHKLRIILTLLVLNFEFLPVPEPLNSPLGQQKSVVRPAQQCYVRLTALS